MLRLKIIELPTKTIDHVANFGFGGFTDDEIRRFPQVCSNLLADRLKAGLTMDDVLSLFRETGLDSHRGKTRTG